MGKTALVEGLAQRIAEGDVPAGLRNCQLMALDMGLVMAGACMVGGEGRGADLCQLMALDVGVIMAGACVVGGWGGAGGLAWQAEVMVAGWWGE